jgi:hypothetical protein
MPPSVNSIAVNNNNNNNIIIIIIIINHVQCEYRRCYIRKTRGAAGLIGILWSAISRATETRKFFLLCHILAPPQR